MKIELKILQTGDVKEVIGYDIVAESKEDNLLLGNVRNLHFFGFDDTYIKYDGMESKDETPEGQRLVNKLKFIQEKFTK